MRDSAVSVDSSVGGDSATGGDAAIAGDSATGADTALPGDSGGPDAGLDSGVADAGLADSGTGMDAALDAADGGPTGPVHCTADVLCARGTCLAGICREITDTALSGAGFSSVARMVSGTDADGVLRLLTDDGTTTYDVVGFPGSLVATAGGMATDVYPLRAAGRGVTATSHSSFTQPAYRGIVVDQVVLVHEDRPVYYQTATHTADGTAFVLTLPRYPRGAGDLIDVYPLRLWSPGPSGYEFEDLERTVATRRDFHLRPSGAGEPVEVLGTASHGVDRWRLELGGWTHELLHRFDPFPGNTRGSRWVNDSSGRAHLIILLQRAGSFDLGYVEIADTGIVRTDDIAIPSDTTFGSELAFDESGDLHFITWGEYSSPGRRVYRLHRIGTDGAHQSSVLGTLRWDQDYRTSLAVQPDGDIYVFLHSPSRDMIVREIH